MKKWIIALFALSISASGFAFPLTLEHKYGTLTLDKKPQRIVSVGYTDHDDILTLGITPLTVRDWYGHQPYGVWPWAQTYLGDATPLLLQPRVLDYEAIAALKPDIIIGITSAMNQREYEKLSAIAPTLAQPKTHSDYTVPWELRHLNIGKVLGLEAQAQENIAALQQKIADVKHAHPEFVNKTAAVAFYYSKQPGAYTTQDLRSQFLMDLGFVIPAEIDTLAGDAFYASFSEERLDILDVDVLVWLADKKDIESESNFAFRSRMPFYKQQREYFTGQLVGGAFSFFSYPSIHFLLDEMLPKLADIAAKTEAK